MLERLQDVQHDEDETARAGHGDHLPTATLAVFSTLDDTRQIKELEVVNKYYYYKAADKTQKVLVMARTT